jgi:hypothetical protein
MSHVSWNRQLGLAIALFSLGTLTYWLEFKHKPSQEAASEESKKLFVLKDSPVKSVSLTDAGKTLTLTCSDFATNLCKPGDNSKWEVSEPARLKADDANVNSLISALNNLTSNDVIDLKDETQDKKASLLKEYGLDPASLKMAKTIKLTTNSGETLLYFGQTHPMGDSVFAVQEKVPAGQTATGKIDESHIYMIGTYFKANFDHDLAYWRNKKLFSISAREIASLKLEGGKEGSLMAEKKEGNWILHSKNEELDGDIENIDNLLNAATFLSAKSFVSDNKGDAKAKAALAGFSKVLTVTLQKEQGQAKELPAPVELNLFRKKPFTPTGKLLATLSNLDPLFELDPSTQERMNKTAKDLRLTKLITSMDKFSAKRLEFSGKPIGGPPLVLKNENGKWLFQSDKTEASGDKVQNTLDKLSGNRIQDFMVGKSIPAGEQDGLKVMIGDDKTEAKRHLIFWKKDGKLYARDLQPTRAKKSEAYLIDTAVESGLPWTQDFFKVVKETKPEVKPQAKTDTKPAVKTDAPKK